jgi:hypothetical protein
LLGSVRVPGGAASWAGASPTQSNAAATTKVRENVETACDMMLLGE